MNFLWYSYCELVVMSNLLICWCDVFLGSFGVGIYVRIYFLEKGKDCVIVGILFGFGCVYLFDG